MGGEDYVGFSRQNRGSTYYNRLNKSESSLIHNGQSIVSL